MKRLTSIIRFKVNLFQTGDTLKIKIGGLTILKV